MINSSLPEGEGTADIGAVGREVPRDYGEKDEGGGRSGAAMAAEQGHEPAGPALQALDATGLRAVLAELRPALLPSRFEKAQQSDGQTVQLGLRSLQGQPWLELSWLAEAPRLLAIPPPARQGEGSTLARQLQHGLRGLTLVSLEQQGWERVVELAFAPRPGEPARRTLVLELMARHSNLFLLDEERRVIALAHQVRPNQSRLRPIGTGDPYQPPPPLRGDVPCLEELEESWRRRLSLQPLPLRQALPAAYQGISPALVRQLCEGLPATGQTGAAATLAGRSVQELSEADWHALHRRWRCWLEVVETERFRLRWLPGGGWSCWDDGEAEPAAERAEPPEPAALGARAAGPALPLNTGLAQYYAGRLGERQRRQRRHSLARRLEHALERERLEAARQQALLDAVPTGEGLRQQADALLCRPSPSRAEIEEAQKLYRRARKLRRSLEQITPRLEAHRQRQEALEASLTFLEQADDEAALAALEEECAPQPETPRRRSAQEPRPLELRSPGGLRLQVGRNHRQNEWISLRQARRGDLWFHAQELPGSHVVLKASEVVAAEADLQAAADLAAHFSRGRGNRRVPVVMVAVEDLQRIPGATAGTVRHRGGTVLWAEPERATTLLSAPNVAGEGTP
ncbi:MAG: NFACT RNA binding domain-containing protein [Synechococcaceae cyanobacterium]|nr:NFACT RNA binding domain-containing protein [Synechococcaceae cyanobacterium]